MALFCPNAECPFLKRHGFAPSYRAGQTTCADCGATLVETAEGGSLSSTAPFSAVASAPRATRLVAAQLISLATVAGLLVLQRVPLPFVDLEYLGVSAPPSLSLAAIGVAPWVTAALLVEIAAAVVPGWRSLRLPAARARLTRITDVLGVVVALAQAAMLVRWLSVIAGGGAVEWGEGARWVLLPTIVAGGVLCRLGARLIDSRGVGGGMSLLVAVPVAMGLLGALVDLTNGIRGGALAAGAVALALVVIAGAAAIAVVAVRPLPDGRELPQPAAGLLPLVWAATLMTALAGWLTVPPGAVLVVALVATPILAGLLHWRTPGLKQALPLALGVIGGLGALDLLRARADLGVGVAGIVIIVCVLRDVVGEIAFVRGHGAVARIATLPSLAAAQRAQQRCADVGIATHVRAAHHRALFHFFAPHLSLDLLAPVADAERALGLVSEQPPAAGA